MKTLDCGCELSPGGRLVSLCAMHAEHMSAVAAVATLPHDAIRETERALILALAPVMLSKWGSTSAPVDVAEALVEHAREIARRTV